MGYESNLFITQAPLRNEDGEPTSLYDGVAYCRGIAEFDLCKVGSNNALAKLFSESIAAEKVRIEGEGWRYGVYELAEGNTLYSEDKYGEPLSPVPLDHLIVALTDVMGHDHYRRYAPLLAMLQALSAQAATGAWGINGVVVLHYGH